MTEPFEFRNTAESSRWQDVFDRMHIVSQDADVSGRQADAYIVEWRKRFDRGEKPSRDDLVDGLASAGQLIKSLVRILKVVGRAPSAEQAQAISDLVVLCASAQGNDDPEQHPNPPKAKPPAARPA